MRRMLRITSFCRVLLFVQCLAGNGSLFAQLPEEFSQLSLSIATSSEIGKEAAKSVALLIHFHGAPATTADNFQSARLPGVLVTVNCNGLSSAYRKPFENDQLFSYLIEYVREQLVADGVLRRNGQFSAVGLSCFSAGYGAVREILKSPQAIDRVASVVAADSIYASIHIEGKHRKVDEEQMQPFLEFAQRAARNEKDFLISHSQLPVEPYASTVETADYLLTKLSVSRLPIESANKNPFAPIAKARLGSFIVVSYPGSTGERHLDHLRNIGQLWKAVSCEK